MLSEQRVVYRRDHWSQVGLGYLVGGFWFLLAIAGTASAQDANQTLNAKVAEINAGAARCKALHPELAAQCTNEQANRISAAFRERNAAIGGLYQQPSAWGGTGGGSQSCRWVGREWMCDYPGGRSSTCRWVGINWTC